MSDRYKEEFPPLLPAGFHPRTLEELRKMCVDAYPTSQRRPEIMSGLEGIHGRLVALRIEGEIWVDGSFLTKKEEPGDVDLVVFAPALFWDHGNSKQTAYLEWLSDEHEMEKRKDLWDCHTFAIAQYQPGSHMEPLYLCSRNDFENRFGHSVTTREPKGIAVIQLLVPSKPGEGA